MRVGAGGPDAFRGGTGLPYHGVVELNGPAIVNMEKNGILFGVALHEIGHVLGIGSVWAQRNLLSGAGTYDPVFTGAQATAAYDRIFKVSANGVPVEASGGYGTAGGHWRESIFGNELMTGWVGPGTNLPLSEVTIGSLADIGYTVDFGAADLFVPPTAGASVRSPAIMSSLLLLRADPNWSLWHLLIQLRQDRTRPVDN